MAAGAASGASGGMALPSAEKMVLSYTPWHTLLAPELKDKRVLLVGDPREKTKAVAAGYGMKHVTHYTDYATEHDGTTYYFCSESCMESFDPSDANDSIRERATSLCRVLTTLSASARGG